VIKAQKSLMMGNHILDDQMKSNSDKNQSKLPWWVELLFVQIGLPDSWLSKFLKKKKQTSIFIIENKKYIIYCALLTAGIFYIYPIVRYTSSSSSCINNTTKYLKSNNLSNSKNEIDINSLAVGFCHGGTLPR
tara:strand:- start:97 stop:495 length:399 start_codon:yes stop_codon:yes gene_type:complete